jgi:hypothetical protein
VSFNIAKLQGVILLGIAVYYETMFSIPWSQNLVLPKMLWYGPCIFLLIDVCGVGFNTWLYFYWIREFENRVQTQLFLI